MTLEEIDPTLPVRRIPGDGDAPAPRGAGLCLSGGGYRAMLFHTGVLRRLYETGVLGRLSRISSVSGGSITAGVVAMAWPDLQPTADDLDPQRFHRLIEQPIVRMASTTIDVEAVVKGGLNPWASISDEITERYRETLFGDRTLADLPETPTFIINATNLASGALVRFTRAYVADWRVGWIPNPTVGLARAVAASSAFPPFLAPHELDLHDADWRDPTHTPNQNVLRGRHRGTLTLADGGVYDNLGLETVWKRCKTVIVSDAGLRMAPDSTPPTDWGRGTLRVLNVIDHQVRSLRKRQLMASYRMDGPHGRDGMYIATYSDPTKFPDTDPDLAVNSEVVRALAETPTRLAAIPTVKQHSLINWGYTVADAGLRSHLRSHVEQPQWPQAVLPYDDASLL